MSPDGVEAVDVAGGLAWLPWAVQYFFLIGLSYGAYLVSLPGLVFRRRGWEGISRLALLAALLCGLTAPVALLADLHQPGPFGHFYADWAPDLSMSWGAFFIPAYLTGLILFAWLAFRPALARHADEGGRLAGVARRLAYGGHESRKALIAAALLAFVGAALVALYTGVEVMLVRARPLWHTPLLPVQFFFTALAGGLGLVLVFNRVLPGGGERAATQRVAIALALTQVAALLVGAIWLTLALSGMSPVHAQALAEVAPSANWTVSAVWAVAAALVTLVLALLRPGSGLLLGLLGLHSAWMMRWTIFSGGQVLKPGPGDYSFQLALGPEALLGIAGTAGLWLFLFIVLTTLLPLDRIGRPDRAGE